jgi:hypothetical protein
VNVLNLVIENAYMAAQQERKKEGRKEEKDTHGNPRCAAPIKTAASAASG